MYRITRACLRVAGKWFSFRCVLICGADGETTIRGRRQDQLGTVSKRRGEAVPIVRYRPSFPASLSPSLAT